jgi:hypothetical protein
MGEKWSVKFSQTMRFPRHCRVLLHAAKLRHGTDGFISPPKEGMLRIFRPGLNSRTWVPEVSMLITRPAFLKLFQVGTTFISQNVLRTALLLSPLKENLSSF